MRIAGLAQFRLRAAVTAGVLVAPVVTLTAVQLIGLSGGDGPAALQMVTAACLAFPVLAWAVRQVLDAEPDDQALLSALAVGGAVRGTASGLLAAACLAVPAALTCAWLSLLPVDEQGVTATELLAGSGVAVAVASAATAVGAVAARAVAGTGAMPVVVLVAAPILVAVLGLADVPGVDLLVPRLAVAVRAAYDDRLTEAAPAVIGQVLLWSCAVLALRLTLPRS